MRVRPPRVIAATLSLKRPSRCQDYASRPQASSSRVGDRDLEPIGLAGRLGRAVAEALQEIMDHPWRQCLHVGSYLGAQHLLVAFSKTVVAI